MMNGKPGLYKQWITLFENDDDDEYDGALGLQDDEDPRILFTFNTKQEDVLRKNPTDRKALSKRSPDRKAPAAKVNLDAPATNQQKNNFASPRVNKTSSTAVSSTQPPAKKTTVPVKTATVQKSPVTSSKQVPQRQNTGGRTAPAAKTTAGRTQNTQQKPVAEPKPEPEI